MKIKKLRNPEEVLLRSGKTLKQALESHRKWLLGEDGERLVLEEKDLSYTDLRGVDLTFADLSYTDLTGADLRGANLTFANLRGANLTSTVFLK